MNRHVYGRTNTVYYAYLGVRANKIALAKNIIIPNSDFFALLKKFCTVYMYSTVHYIFLYNLTKQASILATKNIADFLHCPNFPPRLLPSYGVSSLTNQPATTQMGALGGSPNESKRYLPKESYAKCPALQREAFGCLLLP